MNIVKKIKCVHCQTIIEENGVCKCGKIKIVQGTIIEGALGLDYIDISAKLLNESF